MQMRYNVKPDYIADVHTVRVKSELLPLLFSRFGAVFENEYKEEGSHDLYRNSLLFN